MPTESFVVTALPHSASPTAPFHVSLYLGHRLTPDSPTGTLTDFPHVRDWTASVADAEITLFGHRAGQQPVAVATRRVGDLRTDLWPRVFPGDLPVAGWEPRDLTATPWRTFPAHRMDVHAKGLHGAAITASAVVAPQPSELEFLGRLLGRFDGWGQLYELYERHRDADKRGHRGRGVPGGGLMDALLQTDNRYDEQMTAQLDRDEPGLVKGNNAPSAGAWSALDALIDAHAARRYYQRAEDAFTYATAPEEGRLPPAGPVPPPAEFHQRVGRLGDASPLLRSLGLVVDLVVEDLDQLAGLEAVSADLVVPGLTNPVPRQPLTRCTTQGQRFTAASSSGRWESGMLRLGDEKHFTVLDLDPDASALKLEQYLRTVPRLLALEANRSQGSSAAPATLRATGFSIAEPARASALHDRVDDGPARARAVLAGSAPPLDLEQVTRGMRLEVWDDVSRRWHSLHRRRVTVAVDGAVVLDDAADEGFLQGAALTQSDTAAAPPTTYAHEVLAGWDGWSLAAPRPEKVVEHVDGDEVVRQPADPVATGDEPVSLTSTVEPGTLPKLRYGRRYAFRALAVDLAGNSRGPAAAAPPSPGLGSALTQAASSLLSGRRSAVDGATDVARAGTRRLSRDPDASILSAREVDRLPAAHRTMLAGFQALTRTGPTLRVDRQVALRQAFEQAAAAAPYLHERSDAGTSAEDYADALVSAIADPRGLAQMALSPGQVVATATDLVTVPRPFLRWSALIEPAVVPQHPYTWGESLLRLVVRSGVAPDGGLTPPADYAAAHPGLGWLPDSSRHLAPPKTSLLEAELHGKLDAAIATTGAGTAAARRTWLGLALRESGTFVSPDVADPANPGRTTPVTGLSFHLGDSAAPLPDPVTGNPVVPPTPQTLRRGDPLLPGQYAVHATPTLTVPYLPDPMASGLSLVFPDADPALRTAETAAGHLGVQSLTLRYRGTWPLLDAYRLVLQSGDQLDGVVEGNVLTVSVPPGEQLRVRLSSAMDPASLELFGLWRTLHSSIRSVPSIAEAAADGWLWWLTPAAEMTLVHAVPRPVLAPQVLRMRVVRQEGQTSADLLALVRVHAPSTARLDIEASWSEQHDDLAQDGPTPVKVDAVACHIEVGYDEPVVLLLGTSAAARHEGVHHFGDTRHRTVDYTVRATTRYREFFPVEVAADKQDLSRISTSTRVVVDNTARPAKVVVRDVLPLLVWSDATEVAQPFGVRRTRRAGVRIYLDRPWYTTGNGELLGVVVGSGSGAGGPDRPVSQWAADPVWGAQVGPANATALPFVQSAQLLGGDPAGQPVTELMTVQTSSADRTPVAVRGFTPEYNADRRLWFVDVLLTPGTAFWPFVRLAVARFQPNSLPGCHLGPVVRCDYAQLIPERSLVVARTDADSVKVAVSGVTGRPAPWGPQLRENATEAELLEPSRTLRVRLERRVPEVGTDLGWQVLEARTLPVLSKVGPLVTWEGRLDLPSPAGDPARPGRAATGDLRVVVEEEERLQADPGPRGEVRTSSRIVYSDEVVL